MKREKAISPYKSKGLWLFIDIFGISIKEKAEKKQLKIRYKNIFLK